MFVRSQLVVEVLEMLLSQYEELKEVEKITGVSVGILQGILDDEWEGYVPERSAQLIFEGAGLHSLIDYLASYREVIDSDGQHNMEIDEDEMVFGA